MFQIQVTEGEFIAALQGRLAEVERELVLERLRSGKLEKVVNHLMSGASITTDPAGGGMTEPAQATTGPAIYESEAGPTEEGFTGEPEPHEDHHHPEG